MSNPENPNFDDDFKTPEEEPQPNPQGSDLDLAAFFDTVDEEVADDEAGLDLTFEEPESVEISDVIPVDDDISIDDALVDESLELTQSEETMELPGESQFGENSSLFADDLESFADFGTSEAEELIVPEMPEEETLEDFVASEVEENVFAFDDADLDEVEAEPEVAAEMPDDDPFGDFAEVAAELPPEMPGDDDPFGDFAEVATELPPEMPVDDLLEDASVMEAPVVVEDKKAKKGKKEKPAKKEKAPKPKKEKAPKAQKEKAPKVKKEKTPKIKKEKKPKELGERQPQNVAALCFAGCLLLMLLSFVGVNAYAFVKFGMGSLIFLAIFDLFAAGALVIPILLRRAKNNLVAADVTAGIAAISLIYACMFLLANIAFNFG